MPSKTHKKIVELLSDGNIHHIKEFEKICSYDGLRGRISELNKWGYVIRRTDEQGIPNSRGSYFKCITIPTQEKITNVLTANLKPDKNGRVEIIPLGDIHYGNPCFTEESEAKLDGYIDYILKNDGVYTILTGDIIESANERATFKLQVTPQEQYEWALSKFMPLAKAGKIIVMITGNHECLDEKTEIYTKDGWRKYTEIHKGTKVLTLNKDMEVSFNPIKKLFIFKYTGTLNRIKHKYLDTLITSGHRLFYRKNNNYTLDSKPLNELLGTEKSIDIPIAGFPKKPKSKISDEFITLLALVTKKLLNSTDKDYKFDIFELIEFLNSLDNLHIDYKLEDNKIIIRTVKSRKRLESLVKYPLPKWINSLSQHKFQLFLTSLLHLTNKEFIQRKEHNIISYEKSVLEALQIALIVHGYATRFEKLKSKYKLTFKLTPFQSINLNKSIKTVNYNGDIWDIEVKNHNFLVRREGTCYFTGNSWVYNDKGFDIIKMMSLNMNVPYLGESGYIGLKVGKQFYTAYVIHPRSAVTKKSTKIRMLEDLGSIHDVDIIMSAHIHSIITEEQILRSPNFREGKVENRKQLLIGTGAFLEYGDYAEQNRYKPEKIGAPKIKLYSHKHDMHVGK